MRGLTAPPAWTGLAAGLLACACSLLFAAPDCIDRTRISIQDGGTQAVMALEAAVASHNTDPAVTADSRDGAVVIAERRSGGLLAVRDLAGRLLADQAVDDVRQQAAPAPAAAAARPDELAALLVAQRQGVQAEIGDADQAADGISVALSQTMRDIADLQRTAGAPSIAGAPDPTEDLLAQLQMRRIDLAAKYTADFPGIAAIDGEIEQLKALAAQRRPKSQGVDIGPALTTLRAEQHRLEQAQAVTAAQRSALVGRRDALDATLAAHLTAPAAIIAAPAPVPSYLIEDAASTTLPDMRPWLYAASLGMGLVLATGFALLRRRAVPSPFALHVRRIERGVRLPVLRCLDISGLELSEAPASLPYAFKELGRGPVLAASARVSAARIPAAPISAAPMSAELGQ